MSADTRNLFLANALEVMEITENRFSGIPTVIAVMREAGLSAPKFESEICMPQSSLEKIHI